MNDIVYTSIEQLINVAKETSGHRISEYNINNRPLSKNNKGVIGQIIEEGVFHYKVNSNKEADFSNLGVELKVTGIKQLKNKKYVAKERLVLNIINYMEENNISFEDSSFWKKNKSILLMFYLYDQELDDFNYLLIDSFLNEFNDKDLAIIKNDWSIIQDKINNGKAEEISEGDTMYLAACTKGSSAENSYREQPNSSVKAKQRAYCLKQSYMNALINKKEIDSKCEQIVTYEDLKNSTFEYCFSQKLEKYYNMSEDELFAIFDVNINTKNKFNYLLSKMLGLQGKNINNTEEFIKSNLILKTIRVEEDGKIRENMSFPTFKYTEIVNQEFEDSDIYNTLSTNRFVFIIFKKKNGLYYFDKIKFWNMPLNIIETKVKEIFDITKNIISTGNIISDIMKNGAFKTNFPGAAYNHICHVRPHDQLGIQKTNKGYELPVADQLTGLTRYTKYCFWLDRNYIKSIIDE